MHLCSDAQKPRSVKTAPAVLTYRISCINATDSKCRRAIKPKALKLSTLSANSRGDDKSRRSHSSVCRRHLRECKSRTSSPEQTFAFQSRQRFCRAARFSVSPEGLGQARARDETEEWKGATPGSRRARAVSKSPTCFLSHDMR